MTEPRARRLWPFLAWLWLAAVMAVGAQQVGYWRGAQLDSDVLALLPGDASDPMAQAAGARIVDSATRQVIVLVSGADWPATRTAAKAFLASLQADAAPLQPVADDAATMAAAIDLYAPHRRGLLTPAQRARLRDTPEDTLVAEALSRLYGLGPAGGLLPWQDDPLGLWPDWWQARAGRGVVPRDGLLSVTADGRDWALLRFDSQAPAFQLDGQRVLQSRLDQAGDAARAAAGGGLRVLHGGVPLHAEAAASQAAFEVNTIGLGSLCAVVLLVWLAFRSLRPIVLVSLSLVIGVAAGLAATSLLFGKVHLLTLVFGASLVGVAEDYGIHYFACRQGQPGVAPRSLLRQLLPGLVLALATSALAYLALGIAPFPGLRQMAVFSAAGLTAAFLTVVLWFPWLDRGAPRATRFAAAIGHSLATWPRWRATPLGLAAAVLAAAFGLTGLLRLEVDDSLRSLQSSPPQLMDQAIEIGRVLGLPSPAQYFLVTGADAQAVLEREQALVQGLQAQVDAGHLAGWRAVSDWVPSASRQREDAALSATIESRIQARAAELLDETPAASATAQAPLAVEAWLREPVSEPLRPLWLGQVGEEWGSVVMLEGLGPTHLATIAALADGQPGLRWVDRTASLSTLLAHYREMMGWLLLAGYVAVAAVLLLRFRTQAWRALLPTALAATLSLAVLGWLGVPLQLFGMLAQLLLLGMGVDYGIFLVEHRGDPASWLAVSLGAASTLLAFGLLALSATPALHAFGLNLLLGIGLVWLLSPCFRPGPDALAAP